MATITSANAIFFLTISTIFPTPQQLQGFATDDIFDSEAIPVAETRMGVDGILSAGYVNNPVKMHIMLQADSRSVSVFDTWNAQQVAGQEVFDASGIITLTGLGKKFSLTRGFLTNYKTMPDAKKLLEARSFEITWQRITQAAA